MYTRVGVLIRGLWEIHTDTILGIIFGDDDEDNYKYEPMNKLLDCWEKQNKDKSRKNCHDQWKHFYLFVLSVNDMLGKEALFVLTNLSQLMVENSRNPFHTYVVR